MLHIKYILIALFRCVTILHANYVTVWAILRLLCGDCILKSMDNRAGYCGRTVQAVV